MLQFSWLFLHLHHKSFLISFLGPKKLTTLILQDNLNGELAKKYNFDEMVYWESFLSPFSCLMNHLKTVKVWDYDEELGLSLLESSTSEASLETQGNGIRFLKILLKSAMYLEKLTLYITKEINFRVTLRNPKALHRIAQIIRAFPRASSCMEVSVFVSD